MLNQRKNLFGCILFGLFFSTSAVAQIVHLPPVVNPVAPKKGEPVLYIKAKLAPTAEVVADIAAAASVSADARAAAAAALLPPPPAAGAPPEAPAIVAARAAAQAAAQAASEVRTRAVEAQAVAARASVELAAGTPVPPRFSNSTVSVRDGQLMLTLSNNQVERFPLSERTILGPDQRAESKVFRRH
jgi:hypothetical protein